MTGATSGTGTTYPSGAPAFAPVCLLFLVGFVFFNVVKLHVFTFVVPCCDVRYDFRMKDVRSVFNPICYVGSSCFVCVFFYVYLRMLVSKTIFMSDEVRAI